MKDVFKNWIEEQEIFDTMSLTDMKKKLRKQNINRLKRRIKALTVDLRTVSTFFHLTDMSEFLKKYSFPSKEEVEARFAEIYDLLDGDVETFIKSLQKSGFTNKMLNAREDNQGINTVTKKHDNWFEILFDLEDEDERDEFLFTIANKFYEFCFYPETFEKFKKLLENKETHPIVRMFYSVMWKNLGEIGWQHWHINTLTDLRKEHDSGKEILYIAGGTDIYQLIKSGLYNIRVIDPMLPSQPKYYSEGWEWFVTGELGEEAPIPNLDKKIIMKRVEYKPTGGSFSIKLSTGEKVKIDKSITVWHLLENNRKIGEIVFERRLTNQDDFKANNKQAILISSNELYFIAAPVDNEGWGIDPNKFDDKIKIHVKQLRNPVNKQIVCNMRYEIGQADFAFIGLGSCVD